jgi:uridine kinase
VTAQQRTRKRITESNGNSSAVPWRRVVNAIARKRGAVAPDRAVLVAISGIDASGKGHLAANIADRLQMEGLKVALIGADDWLNLPDVCINRDNRAGHFYEHAMRFGEMFERLIIPLKEKREISFIADCADAKATAYRKRQYDFGDIDIILLEGIFLLKPAYRHHFDLTVWIDCSFEVALKRAIERGQEGLPPAETIKVFKTIYFPAQLIHLARDNPREAAGYIFTNDKF